MAKFYSGKFTPKNKEKYDGDYTKIRYRSSWERQVFKWCDTNSSVVKWNSEEVVIPYICQTDNKQHRYFMDLKVTFSNGKTYLIEIKPKSQTVPPKPGKRKSKKYLREVLTYAKNESKWKEAEKYARERGYTFTIWTEDTIKGMGIRLLT